MRGVLCESCCNASAKCMHVSMVNEDKHSGLTVCKLVCLHFPMDNSLPFAHCLLLLLLLFPIQFDSSCLLATKLLACRSVETVVIVVVVVLCSNLSFYCFRLTHYD